MRWARKAELCGILDETLWVDVGKLQIKIIRTEWAFVAVLFTSESIRTLEACNLRLIGIPPRWTDFTIGLPGLVLGTARITFRTFYVTCIRICTFGTFEAVGS